MSFLKLFILRNFNEAPIEMEKQYLNTHESAKKFVVGVSYTRRRLERFNELIKFDGLVFREILM